MHDDLAVARLGVMAALRQGDAALAFRLTLGLMDDGYGLPTIVTEVLVPIQREAGRLWEAGEATIAEEHVSTAAVETLVAMLAGSFDQPEGAETVVVVCATGDTHSLPARMAGALLAYEGYRAVFLGTSVPADDLAEYLATAGADALVVSCARAASLLGARACVAAGHGARLPVVVGGPVFADVRVAELLGADAYAPTIDAVGEVLQTWTPDPDAAEAAARPVGPEALAVVAARDALAAAVVAAEAARSLPPAAARPAAEELADVLAAAVHLDDAELLAREAARLADLVTSRGGAAVTGRDLLDALTVALRDLGGLAGAWDIVKRAQEAGAAAPPPSSSAD